MYGRARSGAQSGRPTSCCPVRPMIVRCALFLRARSGGSTRAIPAGRCSVGGTPHALAGVRNSTQWVERVVSRRRHLGRPVGGAGGASRRSSPTRTQAQRAAEQ